MVTKVTKGGELRGELVDDGTGGLTGRIIGAAIEVHRALGPGLLESTYEACLFEELRHVRLRVKRQVQVSLVYRGRRLPCAYRMDMLVEGRVVVEIKVARAVAAIHTAQVLTYLRLAGLRVGLLFNFGVVALAPAGIRRVLWGGHDGQSAKVPGRRSREARAAEGLREHDKGV